jgi:phage-related holin
MDRKKCRRIVKKVSRLLLVQIAEVLRVLLFKTLFITSVINVNHFIDGLYTSSRPAPELKDFSILCDYCW